MRRTDALIEELAERRAAGSAATSAAEYGDPAVRLLHALVTDVDEPPQAAPEPTRDAPEPSPSGPGPRRRGPRTIVALGVAGAMLASTGVAAAGGEMGGHPSAAPASRTPGPSDRADGRDTDAARHGGARQPGASGPAPEARPGRVVDDRRLEYERFKQRLERTYSRHYRPGRVPEAPVYAPPPAQPCAHQRIQPGRCGGEGGHGRPGGQGPNENGEYVPGQPGTPGPPRQSGEPGQPTQTPQQPQPSQEQPTPEGSTPEPTTTPTSEGQQQDPKGQPTAYQTPHDRP
ncbi:hypothetical protein [Actinomadura litoris]|uniref:hypothetical protein n=1 Tax=Actinomadura litoris TaxID=2678616 RepID=UPI001FA70A58|nr:hypothetical protein [Actinomadura litoris]